MPLTINEIEDEELRQGLDLLRHIKLLADGSDLTHEEYAEIMSGIMADASIMGKSTEELKDILTERFAPHARAGNATIN